MLILPLNSRNSFEIAGESLATIKDGTFKFDDLILYGIFSQTYLLVMSPKIIKKSPNFNDYYFKNELILNGSYYYYFPVTISNCDYGQIMFELENSDIYYCQNCPFGTYSIHPNKPCLACIIGASCADGILDVYPGFWRMEGQVFSCPISFACM